MELKQSEKKQHVDLHRKIALRERLIEKAIEIWRKEGAPVIHLGPGENCFDLEKLLSNPDIKAEHLLAVRRWLDKINGGKN